MKRKLFSMVKKIAVLSMAAILLIGCTGCGSKKSHVRTITNVSYDPTREFYEAYNPLFEKYKGILQKMELQKNLDTRRACFAGKTKGMQVTSHIQQDKTTGLYQLLCVENSIIYSIHHMYIIMSIALYLTRIIFRWRLMR